MIGSFARAPSGARLVLLVVPQQVMPQVFGRVHYHKDVRLLHPRI